MTLDKSAAAEALAEIGVSQKRSASLYSYSYSAPFMLLTGAMWMFADLLVEFTEFGKHWGWPIASAIAVPLYIVLAVLQSRRRVRAGAVVSNLDIHFWKSMAVWLLIAAFVWGSIEIFMPINGVQLHSFIGLLTGIAYATVGLWMGRRILILGLVIAALTMFGFYEVHRYYGAYMGIVGGGGIMLGGLWLRRV